MNGRKTRTIEVTYPPHKVNPEHVFSLPYPVDNGQRAGWEWDSEPCYLVAWSDGDWSVCRLSDQRVLATEDVECDALYSFAARSLTALRRTRDGVAPFQFS